MGASGLSDLLDALPSLFSKSLLEHDLFLFRDVSESLKPLMRNSIFRKFYMSYTRFPASTVCFVTCVAFFRVNLRRINTFNFGTSDQMCIANKIQITTGLCFLWPVAAKWIPKLPLLC